MKKLLHILKIVVNSEVNFPALVEMFAKIQCKIKCFRNHGCQRFRNLFPYLLKLFGEGVIRNLRKQ